MDGEHLCCCSMAHGPWFWNEATAAVVQCALTCRRFFPPSQINALQFKRNVDRSYFSLSLSLSSHLPVYLLMCDCEWKKCFLSAILMKGEWRIHWGRMDLHELKRTAYFDDPSLERMHINGWAMQIHSHTHRHKHSICLHDSSHFFLSLICLFGRCTFFCVFIHFLLFSCLGFSFLVRELIIIVSMMYVLSLRWVCVSFAGSVSHLIGYDFVVFDTTIYMRCSMLTLMLLYISHIILNSLNGNNS